ncbi:MAG: hypothetical protein QM767_19230 [Anaeromyxobacter sp.]
MRRSWVRAGWIGGLVLVVGAVALLAPRFWTRDLPAKLVEEANATFGARRTRALHVERGEPGTLAEALEAHGAALAEHARQGDDEAKRVLREVLAGARPSGETPASYLQLLVQAGPDLDAVLHASRCERLEYPYDWGDANLAVQLAARLAALRARRALDAGAFASAASDCLDALGLGRDLAVNGTLVGRMVSVAVVQLAAPSCARVGAELPAGAREAMVARVRTLRDSIPGFEPVMREEAVEMQLMLYGDGLPEALRAQLSSRPAAMAANHLEVDHPWALPLFWRAGRDDYDQMIAAMALPPGQRDEALRQQADRRSRLPWAEALPSSSNFIGYARRADQALAWLDLIVLAAAAGAEREASGRWPASLGALEAAGRLTGPEAARLGDATVQQVGDGGGLVVVLPVKPPAEGEDDAIGLRLDAPVR